MDTPHPDRPDPFIPPGADDGVFESSGHLSHRGLGLRVRRGACPGVGPRPRGCPAHRRAVPAPFALRRLDRPGVTPRDRRPVRHGAAIGFRRPEIACLSGTIGYRHPLVLEAAE